MTADAVREGLGRARRAPRCPGGRRCSTWTCTWCTRSRRRRRSRACGWPAGGSAGPSSPWPRWTTTSPPATGTLPIADEIAARQVAALVRNARESGSSCSIWTRREQGIVHVIGPELGLTQPGMVIVCGDSHTSTHGAFGALAFGIGTSEVEHVLATQCIVQSAPADDGGALPGRARARGHGQGPDPRADPPDRHRRRHGLRASSTPARRSGRSRWRGG